MGVMINNFNYEVLTVVCFLLAKNIAAEIHKQLVEVYGPDSMSDTKVGEWFVYVTKVGLWTDERTNE